MCGRIALCFLVIWLSIAAIRQAAADVCGTWKVARVLPTPNVQAKALPDFVGKVLVYSTNKVSIGDKAIALKPSYRRRQISEDALWKQYFVRNADLSLPKTDVGVVEVREQNREIVEVGTILFLRNRNEMVTTWEGVFYELIRSGVPCQ